MNGQINEKLQLERAKVVVVVRMKGCYLHNSGKPKGAISEHLKRGKSKK
jgi:hypothetical protein